MQDTPRPTPRRTPPPSLSEISHLFLTELRQRQTGGAPPPQRKGPAVSIDLTPEEFSRGLEVAPGDVPCDSDEAPAPQLDLVIAHHLAQSALPYVRRYAAHLAAECGRVGLIELGDDGLRLSCFDSTSRGSSEDQTAGDMQPVDAARIGEAIEELSWDVSRWLLFLPGGVKSEPAMKLMAAVGQWTLLVTADDPAGLVSGYRELKRVSTLGRAGISAAILDAEDDAEANVVYRKLSGASGQFLDRAVRFGGRVRQADGVAEHVVLFCRAGGGATEHWNVVAELAARSRTPEVAETPAVVAPEAQSDVVAQEEPSLNRSEEISEPIPLNPTIMQTPREPAPAVSMRIGETDVPEVLDVSSADASGILAAIVSRRKDWALSQISPPACPGGKIAVDRDGRLTLLATTDGSLAELRTISQGYQWLNENRTLIRMALPQMNVDAAAMPRLTLFAEQSLAANLSAIFQGNVTIQTYRRVRWGEKTGLLLEAA